MPNENTFVFAKTFDQPGTFQALYAAQNWLRRSGYTYGSTCRSEPIGVLKGDYIIGKWRNLTHQEINELDGVVTGWLPPEWAHHCSFEGGAGLNATAMAEQPRAYRTVTIPACRDHGGLHSIKVTLNWVCRVCGGPRGEPFDSLSYDGSRRLSVHS